jgi:hypothetical protein
MKDWYEVHVTFDYNQKNEFIEFCNSHVIKTIDIDMGLMSDIMTSVKLHDNEKALIDKVYHFERNIRKYFDVKRVKVETTEKAKEFLYVELHAKVKVTNQQINNVMLSRNKRKTDELLMTIRDKDLVNFNKKKEKLLNDFKEKGVIMLEKIEIEKVIFDSNMEHDKLWYSQWN